MYSHSDKTGRGSQHNNKNCKKKTKTKQPKTPVLILELKNRITDMKSHWTGLTPQ